MSLSAVLVADSFLSSCEPQQGSGLSKPASLAKAAGQTLNTRRISGVTLLSVIDLCAMTGWLAGLPTMLEHTHVLVLCLYSAAKHNCYDYSLLLFHFYLGEISIVLGHAMCGMSPGRVQGVTL